MCEFCENRKYLPNIQGKDSYLKVLNILGKFFIQYSGVGAQNETAEINYCPICGQKLSEDNMEQIILKIEFVGNFDDEIKEKYKKELVKFLSKFNSNFNEQLKYTNCGVCLGYKMGEVK